MMHHPPESTDWLNVLLAQAILQYREDAKINDRLILAVDDILNGGVKPNFLGPIHVTELNLGEEFPIFSNARIRRSDDVGSMVCSVHICVGGWIAWTNNKLDFDREPK